ncbi:chromosome partitioning protein ParB, partial [Pseudomonas aeruginosa]|nr:chromosome partitioning protein ParB [Pseudomonas aeruginosa]
HELRQAWGEKLPQDGVELFAVLLAMPQDELVRLLAVCVAVTVDVVTPRVAQHQPGAELAQAVGLDMGAWWKPTAEGYFKHVAKAVILEAVGEFAPKHVNRLAKLKKADIASEAERLVEGTGWMPAVFTAEQGVGLQVAQEVAEEPEPTEADDEAHGHTLAA